MGYGIGELVLYYGIDLAKLLLIFLGIINYKLKRDKLAYIIAGISSLSVILITGYLDKTDQYAERILPLLVIVTVCILCQGNLIKKIYTTLIVYIVVLFIDTCVTGIISLLFQSTLEDIIHNNILNFAGNGINIIIIGSIVIAVKIRHKTFERLSFSKLVFVLLFAGAATGIFFISALMITELQGNHDLTRRFMLIVTIVVSFIFFAVCLLLVITSESRDKYKILSHINQMVIESQQRYYTLAGEKQREIRAIQHEMSNHLTCIRSLLNGNRYQELTEYVDQLMEKPASYEELLDSGNEIVNAILNDAAFRNKNNSIEIILDGRFPQELNISPTDLCVIFANAVNNAIEAILRIKNKAGRMVIRITIKDYKGKEIYIDITNPVDRRVDILDGTIKTTKKEKHLHGYGTYNMRQCIEKYNGTLSFRNEEGLFHVEIMLNNIMI